MRVRCPLSLPVNNVRTVSDTKRDFYNHHTRPVNSIYRRVVEELMVEMHLLSVNVDFRYNSIYALGVVSSFNRFMQGYRPERDKESIFESLLGAVGYNPQQYQQDAQQLESLAKGLSEKELLAHFIPSGASQDHDALQAAIQEIAENPQFKYSRLLAVGLFTLLELADSDLIKDEKRRTEAFKQICDTLHLPEDKFQKDLDLYRSNLEKMTQVLVMMEDTLNAERKKREQRAQDKGVVVAPPNGSQEPTQAPDTPQDESSKSS